MGEARHPASSALGRSPRPGTCQVTCASYSSSGWGGTPLVLAVALIAFAYRMVLKRDA